MVYIGKCNFRNVCLLTCLQLILFNKLCTFKTLSPYIEIILHTEAVEFKPFCIRIIGTLLFHDPSFVDKF